MLLMSMCDELQVEVGRFTAQKNQSQMNTDTRRSEHLICVDMCLSVANAQCLCASVAIALKTRNRGRTHNYPAASKSETRLQL